MWLVSQRFGINHWLLAVPWICHVFSHLPPSLMPLSLFAKSFPPLFGWSKPMYVLRLTGLTSSVPSLCPAVCCLYFRRVSTGPDDECVCVSGLSTFSLIPYFWPASLEAGLECRQGGSPLWLGLLPPRVTPHGALTKGLSVKVCMLPCPLLLLPSPLSAKVTRAEGAIHPWRPCNPTLIADSIPGSSSDFVSRLNEKRLWKK